MAGTEESQPLYQRIYQKLSEDISFGRLRPGDRVPSEKELSLKFDVSRITSKRALEMLAEEGLIERVPGKGSFVLEAGRGVSGSTQRAARRMKLIGVVVADFSEAFGTKLLYGLEDHCHELGHHIILYRSQDDPKMEEQAISQLLELGVAGVIIMPVHGEYYSKTILRLVLDKFPLVFVDRHLRGLAASYIGTDNEEAARLGVNYLFDLGHRVISFISPPTEKTSTIEDRVDGFVRSHVEHGLAINKDLWVTGLKSTIARRCQAEKVVADVERVRNHLTEHPEITAVFAEEFNIALIVHEAARQIDRRVPEELSILSVDCPVDYLGRVPYTHLHQREYEMGMGAVHLIDQQLHGHDEVEKTLLPADLLIGTSTASLQQ